MRGFIPLLILIAFGLIAITGVVYLFRNKNSTQSETPVATQTATASPTPTPTSTTTSTSQQVGSGNSYTLGVLVIKYFPLTSDRQNIDISVTGDIGEPYSVIKQRTVNVTNNLKASIEKATRYLGYKNSSAPPSLLYKITDTREYEKAVPLNQSDHKPLYKQLLQDNNICDHVNNKNVREVWLWAYQGPAYPGSTYPYLNISESKMAGPYGDISNSYREQDMPICKYTYRVYTFNYGRGTSEAFESWGHQMEAELSEIDNNLFRNIFQGSAYPQALGKNGRCGSVHNPPNAREEYDRENKTPQKSDCLDWNPDKPGRLSDISCDTWSTGCRNNGDGDNPTLNYMIWNWQNLPGMENTKTYHGVGLKNWWEIHGDFDNVMANSRRLTF